MPSYIAPYRGRDRGPTPGFMEAAGRPGQLIGQGLQQFAGGIAEGVTAADEAAKSEAKLARAAETFFTEIPDEGKPMDPVAFKNLSAKHKIATMQGLIQAQAYKKGQQDALGALANLQYMRAQTELLQTSKADRDRSRDQSAKADARKDLLNSELRSRMSLPDGQQGPIPELGNPEIMQLLAKHGLLTDPNTDNLLSSLARLNAKQSQSMGVPGTMTDVPGRPGMKFGWMSGSSGQFIEDTQTQASSKPPPGYTIWKDQKGEERLVKLPTEPKLSSMQELKAQSLARNQDKLQKLKDMKASGAKRVSYPNGEPAPSSGINLFAASIDDEIQATERLIANAQLELNAVQPQRPPETNSSTPAAGKAFEDFMRWKQGKQ